MVKEHNSAFEQAFKSTTLVTFIAFSSCSFTQRSKCLLWLTSVRTDFNLEIDLGEVETVVKWTRSSWSTRVTKVLDVSQGSFCSYPSH